MDKVIKNISEEDDFDMSDPDAFSKLLKKKEDLDPELEKYLYKDARLGDMIKHPLVFSIMHSSVMNSIINRQLKQKKAALEQAVNSKNFESVIFLHEKPYRLNAFLDVMTSMTDKEYWKLLGEVWTNSENVWQSLQTWKILFNSSRSGKNNIMTAEELKVFKKLPNKVTAYRGYTPKNKNGLSYSLDKKTAEWFANRFHENGKVKTIEVPKSKIIAYFSGRNEEEVIVI